MIFKIFGLIRELKKYLKVKQYKEAVEKCEIFQKENPTIAQYIDRMILNIYRQSGDKQKAKEIEEKISRDLDKKFAFVDAMECYQNAKKFIEDEKYEEAITEALKGIELRPSAELYSKLGIAYANNNQYDEAIEAHKKSIQIKPTWCEYSELSDIYIKQKQYDAGVKILEEGCQVIQKGYIYYLLAKVYYYEVQDTAMAIESLKKGIEVESQDDYCYGLLQKIYFEQKNYNGSIKYGLKAIKYDDEYDIYFSYLAVAYTMIEEFEKALPYALNAIKLNESYVYHDEISDIYEKLKEYKNAIKHQEKAIEIYNKTNDEDEDEYYLLKLANLYTLDKQYEMALKIYKRFLEEEYDKDYCEKIIAIYELQNDQENIKKYQLIIDEQNKKQEEERKQRIEEDIKNTIQECYELSNELITRDNLSKDDCFEISLIFSQKKEYEDGEINRLGGFGIGIDEENWPKYEDKYMDHILTLDLNSFPALKMQYPDYRAISLYISDAKENEAYEIDTNESIVIFLKQEDIDNKKRPENIDYEVQLEKDSFVFETVLIPKKIFKYEYSENDELINKLIKILYNNNYINGAPIWMQNDDREDEGFICQIDSSLVEANFGGGPFHSGIMYIFNDVAFWQC